jgi:hypothetical protein
VFHRSAIQSAKLALSLVFLAAACHQSRPTRPSAESRDQYLILAAELESTGQVTLYDAVRRARPGWFTRATRERLTGDNALMVYVDDQPIGTAGALRRYAVNFAARIRFMPPTEAQVRYGQNNGGRAAIVIETERR